MNVFLTVDLDFVRSDDKPPATPRVSMYTSLKNTNKLLDIREFKTIEEALETLAPLGVLDIEEIRRKLECPQAYTTELSSETADSVMKYGR